MKLVGVQWSGARDLNPGPRVPNRNSARFGVPAGLRFEPIQVRIGQNRSLFQPVGRHAAGAAGTLVGIDHRPKPVSQRDIHRSILA
jgi:hypothetical protein